MAVDPTMTAPPHSPPATTLRADPAALTPAGCYAYFLIKYHSPAYAAVGLLALAAFYFLYLRWDRMSRPWMGPLALAATSAGLLGLGYWQFAQFADQGDLDQSHYANYLWNIAHGNLHYAYHGMNMWAVHAQYSSVLWIPVLLWIGPVGLKLGQGFCLVAAALLAARRHRSRPDFAAWAAAALLLTPAVASQFFYGFHPEFIATPVLVLALGAYREEKLGRFLACALFLACSKEVFTLAVGGILLLAWMERRCWKWILLPGLICAAVMGLYWFIIVPAFAPEGNQLGYLMPASMGSLLGNLWRPHTTAYFLHLYGPMLPLLIHMPRRYLILPVPLMLFYAVFPDPAFMMMWVCYAFPLVFLAAAGLVLEKDAAQRVPTRALATWACAALLSYPLWRESFSLPRPNPAREAVAHLETVIPESAAVVVNGPFTARFTARARAEAFGWNHRPLEAYDYAILDTAFKPDWLVNADSLSQTAARLSASPAWSREYSQGGVLLFHRTRILIFRRTP
ncbi:MAG: DUF2079 domain-containing protein [Fibrobacteres bacterium]|nr:DUF2079 domain-containing protein [Fibrobacterota bacterium]